MGLPVELTDHYVLSLAFGCRSKLGSQGCGQDFSQMGVGSGHGPGVGGPAWGSIMARSKKHDGELHDIDFLLLILFILYII